MTPAKAARGTTVIHVESDPTVYGPDGEEWWDVPIAEVSSTPGAQRARTTYLDLRARQRTWL